MIEISAQPKLKVSNFHLNNDHKSISQLLEKSGSLWNLATVYTVRTYTHLEDQVEVATR